jgi:hypothetical protein
MAPPVTRRRRLLLSAGFSIAAIGAASLVFGPLGFAIAFPIGLLATAWYGDDSLGTCLPLAVMFLIVLLVIGVLLTMLAFVHRS